MDGDWSKKCVAVAVAGCALVHVEPNKPNNAAARKQKALITYTPRVRIHVSHTQEPTKSIELKSINLYP